MADSKTTETNNSEVKKIVLAYSGGLDTSIIIPWLKEQYPQSEVACICTNVGQDEDWAGMEKKALASGASKLVIRDIREEFARDYLFPMLRAGAVYEGKYLLGTSIARPLQAKHQVEFALAEGADALAHGCTGKGNDQVRFELTYKALAPHLKVIAPWRIWDIRSREEAIEYAREHNIPLGNISEKNIYSRDWNIWHMSHEGGDLENPWNRPKDEVFLLSKSPKEAPDKETAVTIDFEKGIPTAIDGMAMKPVEMISYLNKVGGENAIGRADVVENRMVGMKSRGIYETPAGTLLLTALAELEMMNLDREALHYKKLVSMKYAELVYAGKWFTNLRNAIEAFMAEISSYLTGTVQLVLYKGNVIVGGRKSEFSLYMQDLASFGESSYDHADATGFINLFGLQTGVAALVQKGITEEGGQTPAIKQMALFHEK
ncbi:MAG: argininosuccinate synthase [Spirochaetales bacterium]|nr:argininosuccinate synthase [Spirochaetales bacterium]MCF7938102.1 argininosuccinate synthase [Spirochaetales bacterium]